MADQMQQQGSGMAASILSKDNAPKQPKMKEEPKQKTEPRANTTSHEGGEGSGGSHGKRKHKHTHIEHHDNGTHTTRHTPRDGGPDVSYASQDLDAVHDGLEHHMGDPNGDEAAQGGGGADPNAGGAPQMGGGDDDQQQPQPQPQAQPGA